jgi:hypothetical protein
MGRSTYSEAEYLAIKTIIRKMGSASPGERKKYRTQLRGKYDYYISDWVDKNSSFTTTDLSILRSRGRITILED